MAKHSTRQPVADSSGSVVVIRPVVLSAEAYLGRARTSASDSAPVSEPGRHARG